MREIVYRPYKHASVPVLIPARSAGHYSITKGQRDIPMVKPFVQLFWCVKGVGEIAYQDDVYELKPEHVCFYFPGDKHLTLAVSDVWEYYWFTFDTPDFDYVINAMKLTREPLYCRRCPEELFIRLMTEIKDFSPSGQYKASATAYEILTRAVPGSKQEGDRMVDEFKDLVIKHFHDADLSVNKLAGMLAVHRSTLNRIFHRETGITPGEYLIHFRIQEALTLLKSSNFRIKEISQKTGFSDSNYFIKVIRKATGMTPAAFRKL